MRRLPLLPSHTPGAVHAYAREAFAGMLRGPRSAAIAAEIGVVGGAWTDDAIERRAKAPDEGPFACADRCMSCCHLKVIVTPQEVIALAERIATLPESTRAAVVARVIATDARTRGTTARQRLEARLPCPLLEDDRCVAYEARPSACRAANSYARADCERALASPGTAAPVSSSAVAKSMCDAIRGAQSATAMEAGLDGRLLELVAALRIALERPDAALEWSRGRPAFRFAVDDEIQAELRSHRRR